MALFTRLTLRNFLRIERLCTKADTPASPMRFPGSSSSCKWLNRDMQCEIATAPSQPMQLRSRFSNFSAVRTVILRASVRAPSSPILVRMRDRLCSAVQQVMVPASASVPPIPIGVKLFRLPADPESEKDCSWLRKAMFWERPIAPSSPIPFPSTVTTLRLLKWVILLESWIIPSFPIPLYARDSS